MRKWLATFLLVAAPAFAQQNTPLVEAQLLLHAPTVEAGKPIAAGVLFTITDGWHIYGENPGDSGIPTTLDWTLPEGVTAGAIQWPTPERHEMEGLVNYGYSDRVVLPVTLTPSRDDSSGTVTVKADWLVCKDICIPESATLTAELPQQSPQAEVLLNNARDTIPARVETRGTYTTAPDGTLTLTIDTPFHAAPVSEAQWFPVTESVMQNAAQQKVDVAGQKLTLTIPGTGNEAPAEFHGVLRLDGNAYRTVFDYQGQATPPADQSLLLILALAFLGGLLLNLMPCVLPILSLKALALAKKSEAEQRDAVRQGFAYTAGVVASFLAIAAVMLALKAGGAAIGWGFQLQQPEVIAALFLLMLLVALNLWGVFEMPVLFGRDAQAPHSAFATGALAVALATPCTAPFMATALGATLTLPAAISLLVFAFLGLGMAAPFLLISISPRARAWLPRPGMWMLHLKHFLAFPMLATAGWLLWVLVQINGSDGLAIALTGGTLLALAVWLLHVTQRRPWRLLWFVLLALAMAWTISRQPPMMEMGGSTRGEAFSEQRLSELRAAGTPVFVDATAAWCLTCKINERVALEDADVKTLFAERGVMLLVADWTTRDAAITAYLARFGRNGVPLYVYYPPQGEPVVLPQILTPAAVRHAITS